ncbi:MAG: zinc ribbon domain-containing protein [Deltaproteobacteria bacterium]|nr:zinc ribbon domain-containing protein [Deltaproteobacteria bacterium]
MKQKYFILIILLTLTLPATGHTQAKVTAIDSLVIELWPDYDRASVLVLLTGTLSADTTLPATVILPIPETAQLNAVARIDSSDGQMKDDIFSSPAPGGLSFITPDLRFRLEYYLPYAVNNNQRTFNFTWLATVSVNRFQLKVQQPISASLLTTEPVPINVFRGEDGFTYHAFPEQVVQAGQSFSVRGNYTMTMAQLSIERLTPPSTRVQEPGLPSSVKTGADVNWPLLAVVVGGIMIVIVFVWQIATRRTESNRPITHNATAKKESYPKFCSNCDNQINIDDRFCNKCGAALRGE